MAMWLFRRKGSRKQSRVASTTGDFETPGRGRPDQPPDPRQVASTTDITSTNHNSSIAKGKQRKPSAKLQRRPRAYSFSPDRNESIRVTRARKGSFPIPAAAANDDGSVYRVPTLHHNTSRNKRSGQHLPRKKSSKRRKEDHDREAEIKAMSQFMPVRPIADEWTSGRPIKRESKRVRSALNHKSWEGHPSSDVSLPMPESIHSSLSSESEQVSYKISALSALVPRPTLRYSNNPLNPSAATPNPMRASSGSKKLSQKEPIAEATLKAHKRVDDLADDLDAAALRELMERDQRRREQKKERDRERVERRLTKRAERQRMADDEARRSGNPSPPNLERGVFGREIASTEPETTSAVVTSSRRRRGSIESTTAEVEGPTGSNQPTKRESSPLDSFHRTDSIPLDHDEPAAAPQPEPEAESEAQDESTSKRSSSPKLMSLMRSKKTRSNSPRQSSTSQIAGPPALLKTDDAESSGGRTSGSQSSRPWTSFFKWPGRNRRNSAGPSSFSNTSRDSIMAAQANQPPREAPPVKTNSTVPKRTLSRFREDLPELPMSPPDSRKASPEADNQVEQLPPIPDDVQMRYDTPSSEPKSHEESHSAPIPIPRSEIQPSPAPQSMSLASIDSEASWLSSGRMSRQRASSGLRNSLAAPAQEVISDASETRDTHMADDNEDPIGDDEYLDSVVSSRLRRESTGEARPSSDEEEEEEADQDAKWGAVGRTPTVMHHRDTMKSTEGLLIGTMDEDETADVEKDEEKSSQQTSEDNDSPVEPQRARSVNLGKGHVRNFSAGSAKLLELSPRASGEHRRSSTLERPGQ